MPYGFAKFVTAPLLKAWGRPAIEGTEHVPASGAAILASNHLSILDSAYLPLMVDRPMTFIAKQEYFGGTSLTSRLTARFLRGAGQLPVDRRGGRAAQAGLDASLAILERGELFGIYPEGTRSPDGQLYRGRTGIAWLALTADVPVIPVAMVGTDRMLPPGRTVPRPAKVRIRIGPPMTFPDHAGQAGSNRARRQVTDAIVDEIQKLSGQSYTGVHAPPKKTQAP